MISKNTWTNSIMLSRFVSIEILDQRLTYLNINSFFNDDDIIWHFTMHFLFYIKLSSHWRFEAYVEFRVDFHDEKSFFIFLNIILRQKYKFRQTRENFSCVSNSWYLNWRFLKWESLILFDVNWVSQNESALIKSSLYDLIITRLLTYRFVIFIFSSLFLEARMNEDILHIIKIITRNSMHIKIFIQMMMFSCFLWYHSLDSFFDWRRRFRLNAWNKICWILQNRFSCLRVL